MPLAQGAVTVATHVTHRTKHHSTTRIHVVRAGESLSSLARRYHTTVAKLARLNHLDPSHVLLIGTKLRIPAGSSSASTHHVTATRVAYRTASVASVRALLDRWALHYGVSVHLVRALAWMESGYNNASSRRSERTGSCSSCRRRGYVETVLIGHRLVHNADGNVHVGLAYLTHLLHDFDGNERLALAGWYQGERAVRKHGLYKVSNAFVADVLALTARM